MLQFALLAAEVGVSLMGSRAEQRMARAQGRLQRQQIQFAARMDAEERERALQSTLSTQTSAAAANNVTGGRTGRLFEMQARLAASRAQLAADLNFMYQERGSRISQAQQRAQSAGQFAGTLLSAAGSAVNMAQTQSASAALGGLG